MTPAPVAAPAAAKMAKVVLDMVDFVYREKKKKKWREKFGCGETQSFRQRQSK